MRWQPETCPCPSLPQENGPVTRTTWTREGAPLVLDALHTWLGHLREGGWAANPQQIQGPGTAMKFLGVAWLGKMFVVPEAVIDEAQAYLMPKNM